MILLINQFIHSLGITPFNFPAMIPLWMFPMALVTGNCMLMKPSERDPGATMMFMEMCKQAGEKHLLRTIIPSDLAIRFILAFILAFILSYIL